MSSSMMSTPDDAPTVVEESPASVVEEESPSVVEEETPSVVEEETPAVVEEESPAVVEEESPAAVEESRPPPTSNGPSTTSPDGQVNLLSVPINNENDALNVLIGFLSVAQRRGVFAINEAAKIFECVKRFHR